MIYRYTVGMIILKINCVRVFVTDTDGIRSRDLSEIEYGIQNALTLKSLKPWNSYIDYRLNPNS